MSSDSGGVFQVRLRPSGNGFALPGSTSILQGALDAGITLLHNCRNGACGSCKASILDGVVDHGKSPQAALSDAERAAGKALLCCATACSDLTIECREIEGLQDFPLRHLPTRVQAIERLAADVIKLSLALPANADLRWMPGQYLEFILRDGRRRAFSIANAAHSEEHLTLHIRHVPGGEFTGYVFNGMREKEILRIQGPLGTFFLREDSARPIILLAGGTGFAPVKALVEHALQRGLQRPISLYWGARDRAGLYLHELPAQWAAEQAHIRYVPVLSEQPWEGRTGLAHRAVLEDHPDLSDFQVYACGAPAMIDAARADFCAAGLPAEEFFADSFSFASPAEPV